MSASHSVGVSSLPARKTGKRKLKKKKLLKSKTSVQNNLLRAMLLVVKSPWLLLKGLRNLTRKLFLFTSPPAFALMIIGLSLIAFILGSVLLTADTGDGKTILHRFGEMVGPVLAFVMVYAVIVAGYLTATANWDMFITWWLKMRARRKDKGSSITTDFRIVRERFLSPKDRGFLLSMAPALRFPKLPPKKVTYEDDRHVTMIAGSRAGKGRAFIIPNLTHHQGSVIAYDPSGELVRETAEYREKVLGQKVIVLDPFGVTGTEFAKYKASWNPMAEIDFDNDPFAMDKCQLLAESIHFERNPDPFWVHSPRKMLASTIGYVGARSILENCHLGMVRDLLMTSDPSALWVAMSQEDAFGGVIRRFGEANEHRHIEELNSTMELARTSMKWLESPVMEQFVQESSFSMRELKEDDVTIYIVMPAAQAESYKAWIRILFNAAFDVMQDVSIPKPEKDVLFLLDEFPLLGHMERIKRAAGEAAKFGVKLFIAAQDVTQLKEHYGQSWETFIANSGLLIMFANGDLETQQYLSNRLGKELYDKISRSASGQNASTTRSEELRDVARTDEVDKLVSRQSGDAFFFIPGMKPMQLPRANYDEWAMNYVPEENQEEDSGSATDSISDSTVPLAAE